MLEAAAAAAEDGHLGPQQLRMILWAAVRAKRARAWGRPGAARGSGSDYAAGAGGGEGGGEGGGTEAGSGCAPEDAAAGAAVASPEGRALSTLAEALGGLLPAMDLQVCVCACVLACA